MTSDPDRTALITFAIAVRGQIAHLDLPHLRRNHNYQAAVEGWAEHAARDITTARAVEIVTGMAGGDDYREFARGVAALSLRPGGVRVFGIVFCAKHLPNGEATGFRYACRVCAPNDGRLPSIDGGQRPVTTVRSVL